MIWAINLQNLYYLTDFVHIALYPSVLAQPCTWVQS